MKIFVRDPLVPDGGRAPIQELEAKHGTLSDINSKGEPSVDSKISKAIQTPRAWSEKPRGSYPQSRLSLV
jgi:hypothetical protein